MCIQLTHGFGNRMHISEYAPDSHAHKNLSCFTGTSHLKDIEVAQMAVQWLP